MSNSASQGKFTGWHMTIILVCFFGVVVAVNFTMARFAISSFGGTVVDNSYVASQNYNRWLADADKQDALGWKSSLSLTAGRFVKVTALKHGVPLAGLHATAIAEHPLGHAPSIPLEFVDIGEGQLQSASAIPAGRWNIMLSLRQGADIYKLVEHVQ